MENGLVEISDGELLPEDFCWVFEKEGRTEAVLGVREYERGEAGGADSLTTEGCVEVKAPFCGEDGVFE